MKVDSYTKAVLTVIAVALVWIAVRDIPIIATTVAASEREVTVPKGAYSVPLFKGAVPVVIRGISPKEEYGWDPLPVRPQRGDRERRRQDGGQRQN